MHILDTPSKVRQNAYYDTPPCTFRFIPYPCPYP